MYHYHGIAIYRWLEQSELNHVPCCKTGVITIPAIKLTKKIKTERKTIKLCSKQKSIYGFHVCLNKISDCMDIDCNYLLKSWRIWPSEDWIKRWVSWKGILLLTDLLGCREEEEQLERIDCETKIFIMRVCNYWEIVDFFLVVIDERKIEREIVSLFFGQKLKISFPKIN